jgi:basic membrane lipoprotein Med (substrate-binding protein (PBP1-ABC) superfamily)
MPGRPLSTLLHILPLALLATCAGDAERADGGDEAFRVALLTPGPISDQSWNGGAYEGLLRIRDSLGARISHIQTKTPAEFDENFRQYGDQGYDLVIGHGFEYQDAAERVAPSHPGTIYVTTSGTRTGANLAGIRFGFAGASYLAGIAAGAMSRSGVIGAIGGTELPPVQESFRAFAAGVRSVRPDARILTSYIGNWDDVSAGREQALAQVGQGADVLFQNADAAGLGVFQAARESRDVLVVGSNSNQNDIAPDVTIGSVVIDLPHALLTLAREVRDGDFRPRVISFGAAESVVTWVPNPRFEQRIPATARAAVDSIGALLREGRFDPLATDTAARAPAASGGAR